jgi:predicted MFS family arabinose efflux permease
MLMNANQRPAHSLRRRMLPLYAATVLQGFMLWVPVEKLFQSQIGFTAATIGLMAAVYGAMVPIMEIPSGILADRWSRRGVLAVAYLALTVSSLVGGLSTNVAVYIVAQIPLGIYFAMYSGAMDSIVYDTVLEETGSSSSFEQRLGRVRAVESVSLVASALAGGVIANLLSTRLTYFLTVPFAALAVFALMRFREPTLHKSAEREPLRGQIALTMRTITRRGALLPIVALAILTSVTLQTIFEFGPLWLLALSASAIFFGPFWAGLVATLGLSGLLAGRLRLSRRTTLAAVLGAMVVASLTLTTSRSIAVVTVAQITLALLVGVVSIFVTRVLHDSVPSTIRTGVASGVNAFTWLAFLPFAAVFGLVGNEFGVGRAGWMLTAVVAFAGAILWRVAARPAPEPAALEPVEAAPAVAAAGVPA